jgi:hypothetical protein
MPVLFNRTRLDVVLRILVRHSSALANALPSAMPLADCQCASASGTGTVSPAVSHTGACQPRLPVAER